MTLPTACPKPRKRKRATTAARRSAEFVRCFGSDERVRWIQAQGCVICTTRPSQNAHVKGGGAGRRGDAALIVPLCQHHHHELHTRGLLTFEAYYGVELARVAAEYDALWTLQQEPLAS